jgi:hypothetical protein
LITTSVSLLHRLRHSAVQQDWQRFVWLDTPLRVGWARRANVALAFSPDGQTLATGDLDGVIRL